MGSLTVRNIDEAVKKRLRLRAAANGRSMEEEVRVILRVVLAEDEPSPRSLGDAIHRRFRAVGGVDLEGYDPDAPASAREAAIGKIAQALPSAPAPVPYRERK